MWIWRDPRFPSYSSAVDVAVAVADREQRDGGDLEAPALLSVSVSVDDCGGLRTPCGSKMKMKMKKTMSWGKE